MKNFFLTLLFYLIAGLFFEAAAQVYVNHAATGMNTGTDWENAYTDLQDALANAGEGDEIWVAEGTYFPGDNPDAAFLITVNLELYGGFSGNESSPNERDIASNETILSGDILGNDIDGDFETNRSDNSIHVLMAPDTSGSWAIDGFTITGGTARYGTPPSGADLSPFRGGGILSFASCTVRNSIFRHNSAAWGGAGCFARFGDAVFIENCTFENNTSPRGALALGFHFNAEVINCQFTENYSSGSGPLIGAGVYIGNSNFTFEDCTFAGNETPGLEGGGMFIWQNPEIEFPGPLMTLKDCAFSRNQAQVGGGLCLNNFIAGSRLVVEGCVFENNTGAGNSSYGGGMSLNNYNHTGSMGRSTLDVRISRTRFQGNSAVWSGGIDLYNQINQYSLALDSCEFIGNSAEHDGGGIGIYSEGEAAVQADLSNLYFLYNSGYNGGGIAITNNSTDTLQFSVTDSWFENNACSGFGGGISAHSEIPEYASGLVGAFSNCTFLNNLGGSGGGGISLVDIGATVLERCTFEENSSLEHGAGFYRSGGEGAVLLDNVALWGNEGQSSIYNDAEMKLRNATLYGNSSGVRQNGNAELSLQNCILANNGGNYQSSGTATTVISLGGNLSGDATLESALTGANGFADLNNTAPLLDANLMPIAGSPCVDAGNPEGIAPDAVDVAGNLRIQGNGIDMGAYESPFTVVGTEEAVAGEVEFFPNPASEFLRIQLPDNTSSPFMLQLFDAQGKMVQQKMSRNDEFLNVKELPEGMYRAKVLVRRVVYSGSFVKM